MTQDQHHIVAVGQIPPPVDGLAYITSAYLNLLQETHAVRTVNISPRAAGGLRYHLSRAWAVLGGSFRLLLDAARPNRICYMPCQSDFGLIYTIFLLAVARILRYRRFLHHHNFGYINERRPLMGLVLRVGGRATTHIFLCEKMRDRFSQTYWRPPLSTIVSNAAFVRPNEGKHSPSITQLRIGLLSNLNEEKGLYLFLDLMRSIDASGLEISGTLAGPVKLDKDKRAIEAAIKDLGTSLTYLGPLYGEDKLRFYSSIDVFVFPTTYVNEAQPTVVFEALAAGNLVLAYDRGCIASQVKQDGLVIQQDQPFVASAISWLETLVSKRRGIDRLEISQRAMSKHLAARAKAQCALRETPPERAAA